MPAPSPVGNSAYARIGRWRRYKVAGSPNAAMPRPLARGRRRTSTAVAPVPTSWPAIWIHRRIDHWEQSMLQPDVLQTSLAGVGMTPHASPRDDAPSSHPLAGTYSRRTISRPRRRRASMPGRYPTDTAWKSITPGPSPVPWSSRPQALRPPAATRRKRTMSSSMTASKQRRSTAAAKDWCRSDERAGSSAIIAFRHTTAGSDRRRPQPPCQPGLDGACAVCHGDHSGVVPQAVSLP